MTTQLISEKQRLVALLLCWFLGFFGGHRFYVGKTGSAVAMLLISLTVIGLIVTAVWWLVDFITIASGAFRDSDGALVQNWSN
jgi:TM2 domain-containing membrane protein YozV